MRGRSTRALEGAYLLPFRQTYRVAAIVAGTHLVGALLTAWYVSVAEQTSGQAVMVWAIWALIDIPVSLIGYELLDGHVAMLHIVVGSLWWFFVAAALTRLVQAIRGNRSSSSTSPQGKA